MQASKNFIVITPHTHHTPAVLKRTAGILLDCSCHSDPTLHPRFYFKIPDQTIRPVLTLSRCVRHSLKCTAHTGTQPPLARVSIYVRQLYPHCPEFMPKPMALMLKIMLDREFLPCDFADSPDFWQELATAFPESDEQLAGGRAPAGSESVSGLELAGPHVKASEVRMMKFQFDVCAFRYLFREFAQHRFCR